MKLAPILFAILTPVAFATETKPQLAPSSESTAHAIAAANGGHGGEGGSAKGGDAKSAATQSQEASADNTGNTQSTNVTYPRQAPSIGQGSLAIAGCGAGGNAGGSNTRGAAFLGIAFTPRDCKLLLAAAAYQAIGMADAACEMVNGITAVKARWVELGQSPPPCAVTSVKAAESTDSAGQPPVSQDQLDSAVGRLEQRIDRAAQHTLTK
jgi:hypothetical protein